MEPSQPYLKKNLNAVPEETSRFSLDEDRASHYVVLGVDKGASRMEIREAYLRLRNAYESGSAALYSLVSDDDAKVELANIDEAFSILGDEVSRRKYDKALGLGGESEESTIPLPKGATSNQSQVSHSVVTTSDDPTLKRSAASLFGGTPLSSEGSPEDSTRIRTTRSNLPIMRLKAPNADSDNLQKQMLETIHNSDAADGDLYRQLRLLAGVTDVEIQERTKISVGYLLAIESNRFERLPQSVYVKGFLRSYFRYISAPEAEKMVNAFAERLDIWQAQHKR